MKTKFNLEYAIGKVKAKVQREKMLYHKREEKIENVNRDLARELESLLKSKINEGDLSDDYRVYVGLRGISDDYFKFAEMKKIERYLTEMFPDCNIHTSECSALKGIRVPTTNEIWAELRYTVKTKHLAEKPKDNFKVKISQRKKNNLTSGPAFECTDPRDYYFPCAGGGPVYYKKKK